MTSELNSAAALDDAVSAYFRDITTNANYTVDNAAVDGGEKPAKLMKLRSSSSSAATSSEYNLSVKI